MMCKSKWWKAALSLDRWFLIIHEMFMGNALHAQQQQGEDCEQGEKDTMECHSLPCGIM